MAAHPPQPLENRAFAVFAVAVTLLLGWTVAAFFGPILWAVVLAVVFTPLNDRLLARWPGRPGRAAGVTLLVIAAGIIIPVLVLGSALIGEAAGLIARLRSGQVDMGHVFAQVTGALPDWAQDRLRMAGLTDIDAVVQRLSAAVQQQLKGLASRALTIGSDVLGGILSLALMLYLTFGLLRDGRALTTRAGQVVPLEAHRRAVLADRFVAVVRATVKGSVVMASVQGVIGGTTMAVLGVPEALLWAVVMTFCALLPAIGSGLVWIPVSLYLFATGHGWQGVTMVVVGAVVIGNVDNVLRPALVGRDTKLPGALVLLTTLGGLAAFGFSGLIIGPIVAALFLATAQMIAEERVDCGLPAEPDRQG